MQVIHLQSRLEQAQAQPWQAISVEQVDQYQWHMIDALGEYPWHQHDERDDCFLVLGGCLGVELPDGTVHVQAGEMLVVPSGVRHRTFSTEGAQVLLFETIV